jgi:branched-chain amino acid transport system substrate-binding protein
MSRWVRAAVSVLAACIVASAACADDTVKIGAIYPLSGVFAGAGDAARAAIEVGEDLVNNPHPGFEAIPLGAGQGLPKLGNARLEVIFADHQGNPSVGQAQLLQLITRDKVVALIGADQSTVTLAVTALAERYHIPFLVPDSMAPNITGRGFKSTFRTAPVAADFAKIYVRFLSELKQAGRKFDTIALVFENTGPGIATAGGISEAAKAAGFTVTAEIGYAPNTTDLSGQVQQLREKSPDAAIFIANAADAALFVKTMKTSNYQPPLMIGDDDGFSDQGFVIANGNLAQGLIDRSTRSPGPSGSPTAIVNELYKKKAARDLDDTSARILQGFLVLADAINRAGSAEPAAIQRALRETDLTPDQLIVGFRGVKFDETGQNILGSSYLVQLQGKAYTAVWPVTNATAKLVLPYKGWE